MSPNMTARALFISMMICCCLMGCAPFGAFMQPTRPADDPSTPNIIEVEPVPIGEAKIDQVADAVDDLGNWLYAIAAMLGIPAIGGIGGALRGGARIVKDARAGQVARKNGNNNAPSQ